ncbi:hypothetical protein EU546_08715 [Candidatus Thorarchaeota archaeon]|nr:MAG: hypothetical protein EU546_08715 [Candidatus Thorarchaeota archaeon]
MVNMYVTHMREIRTFLGKVMTAKRELKEVYYTTRSPAKKEDAKEAVAALIGVQRLLEELIETWRKSRTAKRILSDRKAEVSLKKWTLGLPKRVNDYRSKTKKLDQDKLHRFQELLIRYVEDISENLAAWIEDIVNLSELPKPPRD